MSVISKLNLERLQSPFEEFPFPFIHFTIPPEGYLTFSHEISHLLQFKLREINRWASKGKFIFLVKNEERYRARRECETEVIEYKLNQLYADYYLTDSFFRDEKGSKRDRYYLNARKVYNKRLIKKRAKYINKFITENYDFVKKHQDALVKIKQYLYFLDDNHSAYNILYAMFCRINNTYEESFQVAENQIAFTTSILEECLVEYRFEGTIITVII